MVSYIYLYYADVNGIHLDPIQEERVWWESGDAQLIPHMLN